MVRVITVLVSIIFSFLFSKLDAQNPSNIPCNTKEYKQFDFWVGDWNVYNEKDILIGENSIVKMDNACALQESWTSKNGKSLGTSYSYYNISDQKWHQLWIDNKGYILKTEGFLKNNKMILESEMVNSPKGAYKNRITWIKNNNGTVTQIWEYINSEGKIIQQAFKGIYKKKNS